MGRERKEDLKSGDENTRMSQETDELLVTSKRLLEEMQALTERAHELAKQHIEIVKAIKNRKS